MKVKIKTPLNKQKEALVKSNTLKSFLTLYKASSFPNGVGIAQAGHSQNGRQLWVVLVDSRLNTRNAPLAGTIASSILGLVKQG